MALPRTISSRSASWWPRGADGRPQRRRGRAGVDYRTLQSQVRGLLGKKTLKAEILKRAFEHATGSKKTAAAAAVAAEGRLSPQPLSSGDWSLAVGELLPILGPGCWPFSRQLRSARAVCR